MIRITWEPSLHWPAMSLWLEVPTPETVRVSDVSREGVRRYHPDMQAFLVRLDQELAEAKIEYVPAAAPISHGQPTGRPRRQRPTSGGAA